MKKSAFSALLCRKKIKDLFGEDRKKDSGLISDNSFILNPSIKICYIENHEGTLLNFCMQ